MTLNTLTSKESRDHEVTDMQIDKAGVIRARVARTANALIVSG